MIAVLFEVIPAEGQRETYLDMAARLRPELAQIDGSPRTRRLTCTSTRFTV